MFPSVQDSGRTFCVFVPNRFRLNVTTAVEWVQCASVKMDGRRTQAACQGKTLGTYTTGAI